MEDYADVVWPGTKDILRMIAKEKEEIGTEFFNSSGWTEDNWNQRKQLFTPLKSTSGGDSRNPIMGVERENGWETLRSLTLRFEAQVGIRRMRGLTDLTQFTACKKVQGRSRNYAYS